MMKEQLRRRFFLTGALGVTIAPRAWASASDIPVSRSLPEELGAALRTGNPLVVMVSLDGCPFCKVAKENYLTPLRVHDQLPVVQVDMRSNARTQDFGGALMTHDAWIRAHGVKVAPTLFFFGRGGLEVAERMVGGYIPDFYGTYLDDRLRDARKAVKG